MANRVPLLIVCLIWVSHVGSKAQADEAEPRPNILFCIADDASWPYCGAYGCAWVDTPNFDRVAREGLLFTNAFTPNAKCAPSRACILTGRNSWQLKEAGNHWCYFPAEFKTYCEALSDHGYFVGETGKDWAPGVALDSAGQSRQMAGQAFERRTVTPPAKAVSGNDYAGNFEDFMASAPVGQPWCFWYGSNEPHRAYEFGVSLRNGWRKPSDIDKVPAFWPDNEIVRTDMLDYAFELKYFDDHLGRMLATLEANGQLDNTLVVVTADNGMPFPRAKGQAYGFSNHLPLAMMWPRGIQRPGRQIDDYVSFVDFAPTFMELAKVQWSQTGLQPAAGRSLTPIFQSDLAGRVDTARNHVLLGKERHDIGRPNDAGYPIRGIVQDGWMYIKNFETKRWPAGNPETGYLNCDGSPTKSEILELRRSGVNRTFWSLSFGMRGAEEMYHLTDDPECLRNLIDDAEVQSRKNQMLAQLQRELVEQGDPRMTGQGAIFDRYPYADTSGKGFYERFMAGDRPQAGWVNASDFEKAVLP